MNAIISGRAGLAVMTEGASTRTLSIDEAGEISEKDVRVPVCLLRDVEDLESYNSVTADQVRRLLIRARQREDAFHLVLILLSSRSSEGVRAEAADVLDEILREDDQIQQMVERTLHAVPLPSSADVNAAIGACEQAAAHRALEMISKLVARQPYIADICRQWDALASFFASRDDFLEFRAVVVWEGLFRELVEALASDADISHFIFSALSNPRVATRRNHRAVVGEWVAKWREDSKTPTSPTDVADAIESDRRGRRSPTTRHPKAKEALARVTSQKKFIIQALHAKRIGSARQYIDDLIRYQERASDNEHVCKSLCDLATDARDMGLHDLQLELVQRALDYEPEDVVAQSQRADALKALNRLPEALDAYREAMAQHPEDVVAKNGYAEVLKALNRLPEALDAYREAMAQHPENVVAKNGYAEVLKALNRLPEALDAYREAMAQHPENVVAKAGAACILAALGRSEEALALLPQSGPVTHQEWIAYHIRGMIHLRRGEIDTAMDILEKGATHNPRPASREYFRTALAVAYLRKREYENAVNALDQVTVPMLQSLANILRLHAFGAQGDCARTVEIYRQLPENPEPILEELQQEVHRRYVLFAPPEHDEDWLYDKESTCIPLAA